MPSCKQDCRIAHLELDSEPDLAAVVDGGEVVHPGVGGPHAGDLQRGDVAVAAALGAPRQTGEAPAARVACAEKEGK